MMEFQTRQAAAEAVADLVSVALIEAIECGGRASFLTSGGSTPKAMFEMVSEKELDWSTVDVGLVDDRCVPADHDESNAKLVMDNLLQGEAAKARFVPMVPQEVSAENLKQVSESYMSLLPATFMLLGMGTDGHTASWFPGASNLDIALDLSKDPIVEIDAKGCAVAGEITDRLTLTRSAVAQSKRAVLMIFGEEKKEVLAAAMSRSIEEAPIRAAVEDLGVRLITVWAP